MPDAAAPPGAEEVAMREMIADTDSPYWTGPAAARHQARHLELIESRLGATEAPAGPAVANSFAAAAAPASGPVAVVGRPGAAIVAETFDVELAAIRELRERDADTYWARPDVQQRELDLIEVGLDGFIKLPVSKVRAATGLRSDGEARAAQDAVVNVLRDLPDVEAREALVQGFDEAMPQAAQKAVFAELARRDVTAPAASAGDVARFASTPEGAALARQWGDSAAARLGVLRARLGRILAAVPAEDRHQAQHWIDSLDPAEFRAVANALTGGR